MNMKKISKKVLAGALVLCTVVVAAFVFPTMASEYKDEIIYTSDIENAQKLYKSHTAPAKAGYVFGGWFKDGSGNTQVKSNEDVSDITLYAKFVPAYVLSVKAQNHQGIINGDSKGTIRLISGVDDNSHYTKVGFDVYFSNDVNQYGFAEGRKVYSEIHVNKNDGNTDKYFPTEVFGSQAHYFNIVEIKNVASSKYSRVMYTRPYWETLDGTKVYGLAKYVSIQDGLDGIISIPVNLYTAKKIAAGLVELTYPKTLTYIGYQDSNMSRLFTEFEVNADKENRTIACVGNVADAAIGDLQASSDIYVSLRFKIADGVNAEVGKTRFAFDVTNTEFCNWKQEVIDFTDYVWDIQF